MDKAIEAVRALEIGVRQERLVRGEPTDRQAQTIEQIVERESKRWLRVVQDEVEDDPEAG